MSFVASDMSITELGEVPADARLPTDYGDFRIARDPITSHLLWGT